MNNEDAKMKSLQACQTDPTKANWKKDGDIFEREQYADKLSQLIRNTTCPYVIALSSALVSCYKEVITPVYSL